MLVCILAASPAFAAQQSASPSQGSAQPSAPAGCDTPESHQWDFWVGKWEVHQNGADKIIAHSLIEKKYSSCAIRENWMPVGHENSGGGGSLSIYDPRLKEWRQTWVDSSGARVQLDGIYSDGIMTITGDWPNFAGPAQDALVRMRYQQEPDRQVRQWADSSVDGGRTWKPSFDFLYRRVADLPSFK